MKIYVAKENETLDIISEKFNIDIWHLIRHNKSYKNRKNLHGCPILLPDQEPESLVTEDSETRMRIVRPFCSPKIEQLSNRMLHYCHYLKESLIASFAFPKYQEVLTTFLNSYKEDIKKILQDKLSKQTDNITKAQEYRSLDAALFSLVDAIKTQGLENVKKALKDLKDWPKKIETLFSEKTMRDEDFKQTLDKQAESWRDYVLSIASKDYKTAENLFQDIIKDLHKIQAKLLS